MDDWELGEAQEMADDLKLPLSSILEGLGLERRSVRRSGAISSGGLYDTTPVNETLNRLIDNARLTNK